MQDTRISYRSVQNHFKNRLIVSKSRAASPGSTCAAPQPPPHSPRPAALPTASCASASCSFGVSAFPITDHMGRRILSQDMIMQLRHVVAADEKGGSDGSFDRAPGYAREPRPRQTPHAASVRWPRRAGCLAQSHSHWLRTERLCRA